MHTPDDPTPTAQRRPTCTHPGTISATQTCNSAIHGPWKHLMIANQIQRASTGFYWKVWENKWVFNWDLNEEYVCVWWMMFVAFGRWRFLLFLLLSYCLCCKVLVDFMRVVVVFREFFSAIKLHFELLRGPALSKIVHYYLLLL